MSSLQTDYTLLMVSLPSHPMSLWHTKYKPVSRLHLDKRLALLNEQHLDDLTRIEGLLHWSKMPRELPEAKEVECILATLDSDLLKQNIVWRLQVRTIMAAIRLRQADITQKPKSVSWGYGEVVPFILKNWQVDDFSLSTRFPWINQVITLIESHQTFELEKLLLAMIWQQHTYTGQGHYFDFDAVVMYVLRWDIVYRWQKCDTELAKVQFEKLVNDGLGDCLAVQ